MSQTSKSRPGSLVLLGINHNTAPIEVRERLAIPAERLADATRTLLHQPGIREGLILSTCNRVELLTFQDEKTNNQIAPLPQNSICLAFSTSTSPSPPPTSSPTSTNSASAKPSAISSA